MAGGLLLLSGVVGAFEVAVREISLSKLADLLKAYGKREDRFLQRITGASALYRIAAAITQALCNGIFVVFAFYTWVLPRIGESKDIARWPVLWRVLLILGLVAVIKSAAHLVGDALEERIILRLARAAWLLTAPLRPLAALILAVERLVARSLGHADKDEMEDLEEDVIAAVSDSERAGLVDEEQREMIERLVYFKDMDVADIFTPRTEMISIPADASLSEAIRIALEAGHSRLPVYRETRDNVIGIFYVRDALEYWDRQGEAPPLEQILRKPLFVPETKNVAELLQEIQRTRMQIAVVLDEYGGTAGLVTIEDVLEEIVGEIQDEYDKHEEVFELQRIDEHTLVADGHVHVSDVNEALGVDVIPEDDDFETLAGFVLDNLGHIPRPEEGFAFESLRVKILSADERRVGRVEIRLQAENGENAG